MDKDAARLQHLLTRVLLALQQPASADALQLIQELQGLLATPNDLQVLEQVLRRKVAEADALSKGHACVITIKVDAAGRISVLNVERLQ